jgi:hypothetical protein
MLRKLSGDPENKNGTCQMLWATEGGAHYVESDPERLAQLELPAGESAVVVPAAVLKRHFRA